MAHIALNNDRPGISGLLTDFPATAVHLRGLADTLLRSSESLSPAEREMIAAFVSNGNECRFCTMSHAAAARAHFADAAAVVDAVLDDPESAEISERMRALLAIAARVRRDGRLVLAVDVERARNAGADDRAIHDTVLIAAAFSMYNRYVEGLGTWAPEDPSAYVEMGRAMAEYGYVKPPQAG